MNIRRAVLADLARVINLIDEEFTKEGFGFVNRAQIETEVRKRRVFVAEDESEILGCRIGTGTVWNLAVVSDRRGEGIGKALIEVLRPHTIRVKSDPVGHLSKQQKADFIDPSEFYEKLGFRFWGRAQPRNFWAGATKEGKRLYYTFGNNDHIKIYRDPDTLLFD